MNNDSEAVDITQLSLLDNEESHSMSHSLRELELELDEEDDSDDIFDFDAISKTF